MEFRDDLIEAQKARVDLFKWKLILVAGLGAAASGLVGTNPVRNAGLLLALIPLVSLYVDILCNDLTLRIVVIAKFLELVAKERAQTPAVQTGDNLNYERYEVFVSQATTMTSALRKRVSDYTPRKLIFRGGTFDAYAFFMLAQYLSTLTFVIGVFAAPCIFRLHGRDKIVAYLGAGIGLTGLVALYAAFANRFEAVQDLKQIDAEAARRTS